MPPCRTLGPEGAAEATRFRDALLARCLELGARAHAGSRLILHAGELSPGCISCARGDWSCLYLNRLCSRRCFYCPKPQSDPAAAPYEGLLGATFESPELYARVLECLGHRGVGFSGGEPFGDLPRLEAYVRAVRERLGPDAFLWAYTAGNGVDRECVSRLASLGLDELRFDLSARGYDLAPIRAAAGRIGRLVVEIPAIPEDVGLVRSLLPELARLGVRQVNLHQLCATPHNEGRLARRGYTVLRGGPEEQPILESELAALRLLALALGGGEAPAMHYCSLEYKLRIQRRIFALRLSLRLGGGVEEVTAAGLLRTLYAPATPAAAAALERDLLRRGLPCDRTGLGGVAFPAAALTQPALRRRAVRAAYWRWSGLTREGFDAGRIEALRVLPGFQLWAQREGPVADIALSGAMRAFLMKRPEPARLCPPEGAPRALDGLEYPPGAPSPLG